MKSQIQVVAAVIYNAQGRILIAKRPDGKHLGGLWEFPGGKLESGETPFSALQRELKEEINIDILSASPFMKISNEYPERIIELDVWRVTNFSGTPHGNEGQPIVWANLSELVNYEFPLPNKQVITQLLLEKNTSTT